MITITISSERAEGKTTVGLTLLWLLRNICRWEVDYTETKIPREQLERIARGASDWRLSDIEKLKPRRISIVVVNTHHMGYTPKNLKALHDIVEY